MEIQTKVKTFRALSNARILFETLSVSKQEEFIKSLNKNPLLHVIKAKTFTLDNICDFNQYEDYFVYREGVKSHELYFINKKDIAMFSKNMKASVINNMKTNNNFKLN